MKLPRQKRDEVSATLAQTLWLILACSGLFVVTAYATDPAWWSSPGTGSQSAVVAEQVVTNAGVVSTNHVPNPYAVVTQGQLKQFTARAVDELNANLANGAGTNLNNLVYGWKQDYATNNYSSTNNPCAPCKPSDFDAMTAGQLKYVGNMVWARMVAAGYTNAVPSWLAQNTNSDHALANLGQLKEVFDFNLSGSVDAVNNLSATVPSAGDIDLTWGLPATANFFSIVVQDSTNNGLTWTTVSTLGATSTSDDITGLNTSSDYEFQVYTTGSGGPSLATSVDPGLPLPPIPAPPTGLTGSVASSDPLDLSWTASTPEMNLSWTASPGATSYRVERETLSTGIWSYLDTASGPSYQDLIYGGGGYHYRVSAVNATGTSAPGTEWPLSRYAVIDLGAGMTPMKITDSGYVLMAGYEIEYDPYSFSSSYYRWYDGTNTPLNLPSIAAYTGCTPGLYGWPPIDGLQPVNNPPTVVPPQPSGPGVSDIDESGIAVGNTGWNLSGDPSTYEYSMSMQEATWPVGQSDATVSPPVSSCASNIEWYLGNDSNITFTVSCDADLAIGGGHIWSFRNIPALSSWGSAVGDLFEDGTEIGSVTGGEIVYNFNPQYYLVADNSAGQAVLLADYDDSFSGGVIPLVGNFDSADAYSENVLYTGSSFQTLDFTGVALSNPVLGKTYIVGNNSYLEPGDYWDDSTSATNAIWWDSVDQVDNIVFDGWPTTINARTAITTTNGSSTTVPAIQMIGSDITYNPPYDWGNAALWEMDPATGQMGNAQELNDLLPANSGFTGFWPSSINDGGAIVGTATDTNSVTHGVMLLPMDLVRETTPGSGTYTHIDAAPIFPNSDGTGQGPPPNQGSPKGVFITLNADLTTTAVGSMTVTIGGPSGNFSGTLTETAANSGVFQNSANTVTVTLPVGTTTSATAIDTLSATINSTALGFNNATVSLVESDVDSLYFYSPITSAEIIFSSAYNPSTVNSIQVNLQLEYVDAGNGGPVPPISLSLSETSAGSKTFVDSVSGLTVTLTSFTGTNSGSVDSTVATFSGGLVGSTGMSMTLIETTATSKDFTSLVTTGDSGAQHTDATPDDPQTTGHGVFYIRSAGTTAMTFTVQTDVGTAQTVTLNPDPNNPGKLISGKLLIVPQTSTGPTSYANITATLQTAAASPPGAGTGDFSNPMFHVQMNGADVFVTKKVTGMFVGQGFCNTGADYQALVKINPSQAAEIVSNPDDVITQADPNLKLNGDEFPAKSLSSDQFRAAIPQFRFMYAVGHGWLELNTTKPATPIPFNGIGFSGSSYSVTPDMVTSDNKNGTTPHKYKLVFLNCCSSANTTYNPTIPSALNRPDLVGNKVQAMYTAFNCDTYLGWSDTVNVVKACRAGKLFFQNLTPSTSSNPAVSVDQAVQATMRDSSLSGFAGDTAKLLDPIGGSQTADTLSKP